MSAVTRGVAFEGAADDGELRLKEQLRLLLAETRECTLRIVSGLSPDALVRSHSPLMSPLAWDLGHIANFEERWLVRAWGQRRVANDAIDQLYDSSANPRPSRAGLPLLSSEATFRYLEQVRERAFCALEEEPRPHPLFSNLSSLPPGFLQRLVAQHEQQHAETMLATLQLMTAFAYAPEWAFSVESDSPRTGGAPVVRQVLFRSEEVEMGTDSDGWTLDNERPRHSRRLASYVLESLPVTNARYEAFIFAGGYHIRDYWTDEGWRYKEEAGLEAPLFWFLRDGEHWRRRFAWVEPVPPDEPVMHVSFHEAAAFARYSKMRLPAEEEWEHAAKGHERRRFPWGDGWPTPRHANLGARRLGPLPSGSHAEGKTPEGLEGLLGDVWEWTSSVFSGYPGFTPDVYREYSQPFFDGRYRVLRGGSWATQAGAIRTTFRNWDFPIRRQIFAGFRLASDA